MFGIFKKKKRLNNKIIINIMQNSDGEYDVVSDIESWDENTARVLTYDIPKIMTAVNKCFFSKQNAAPWYFLLNILAAFCAKSAVNKEEQKKYFCDMIDSYERVLKSSHRRF